MREAGVTPEELIEKRQNLVRRMHGAGVRLVGGADAGIGPNKAHGLYAESVVELAAVTGVVDSLAASTSIAAQVCGLGERKGRLAPGYDADLIVVAGDLARDVTGLREVRQVVLRGQPGRVIGVAGTRPVRCGERPGADRCRQHPAAASPQPVATPQATFAADALARASWIGWTSTRSPWS